MVVFFFLQGHSMVRSCLGFKEIGFEFRRFEKIMFDLGLGSVAAVWIWVGVQWQQRGSGSVVNGGVGLGRWFWGAL